MKIACLMLLAIAAIDFLWMPAQVWDGDPAAWRAEARALLHEHHLWVTVQQAAGLGELGQYFVFNPADGHWYSKYGIVNTLMSLPPTAIEMAAGARGRILILNVWNILLSLLLAAVLYTITGRYSGQAWRRVAFVLACFFGTYLWFYQRLQGSEIYQALFFAVFFECLLRSLRPGAASWLAYAWIFAGLLVLTRLLFGILLPIILAICLVDAIRRRRLSGRFLLTLVSGPILILAILAWVNTIKFGSPWATGYHQWQPQQHLPTGSWLDGVWGLLLSGHWSIFIYFPPLFLALPGARRFAARYPMDATVIGVIFLTTLLVLGKIPSWRGEWSYGPRYMLFILPILALPALDFGQGISGRWGAACLVLAGGVLGFSAWLQIEVNSGDFWFWYRAQQPLQGVMDRELAEYFLDHHEGIILHDLRSHRQNLERTELISHLNEHGGPPPGYLARIEQLLDERNLYFASGREK